jgi:hypothetical protein
MRERRLMADNRFHDILRELGELHDKKNKDYGRPGDPYSNVRGSVEWGVKPWVGGQIRAFDKVRRLQAAARGSTLANEGIEDSLMDLANYAIISLILLREECGELQTKETVNRETGMDCGGGVAVCHDGGSGGGAHERGARDVDGQSNSTGDADGGAGVTSDVVVGGCDCTPSERCRYCWVNGYADWTSGRPRDAGGIAGRVRSRAAGSGHDRIG